MLHYCIPAFCLQSDAELGLLRVEYRLGFEGRLRRAEATALLALARKQETHHLLIDMRNVPMLSVYDEMWLSAHFMPGLVALPLQRLVLIVGSHQTNHQLTIDALHNLVQPAIRSDVQYFDDPETALQWLTDDAAQLPQLLTEWQTSRYHRPEAFYQAAPRGQQAQAA